MAIQALALLRIAPPETDASVQIDRLDDAVIIHTGDDFAEGPEELAETLLAICGPEALAAHQDPRGILFIPDVAAPRARTYDAVVAEVGEGGVWAPLSETGPADYGDIGALLGNVFANLPPSVMAAASSAAQGDQASLEAMAAQVQALLGSSPALQNLAGQLSGMFGQSAPQAPAGAPQAGSPLASIEDMFASFGGGADAQDTLRKMASSMEAEFEPDPEKMAELARGLLGGPESTKKK